MKTNKDILREANAAVSEGNYEEFLSYCTEDTKWTFVGDKTLTGIDAIRQWMTTEYAAGPPQNIVAHLIAEGDYVTAIGDISVPSQNGAPTEYSYCDVWRFSRGKMAELQAFVIEKQ